MNRQLLLVALVATGLFCACNTSKMEVSGRIVGNDSHEIYLERVATLRQEIIDSASLDSEGNYHFEIEEGTSSPSLYNLVYNGERIPMLLEKGDRVRIDAVGNVVRNYTVKGSDETELLRTFYQAFATGAYDLNAMAMRFSDTKMSDSEREALSKEYTELYLSVRRQQLGFISTNRSSLAAVYALFQRLPGDQYLLNGDSDVIYYRTVAEALEKSYPQSPYLQSLLAEIVRMDARIKLASQIVEASYPDLVLQDIYGKKLKLSSLAGKVVLVDFWSAELGNSNVINAEMKQIYAKYHQAKVPFEIYQVAIDTSRPLWIKTVQDQQLPWISVSDLQGRASKALTMYNIHKLPANYLIDKTGTIVGKDLYGKTLEEKLEVLTR